MATEAVPALDRPFEAGAVHLEPVSIFGNYSRNFTRSYTVKNSLLSIIGFVIFALLFLAMDALVFGARGLSFFYHG